MNDNNPVEVPAEVPPTTVVDGLRRTVELLQERGRARHEHVDKQGRLCLSAALQVAVGRAAVHVRDGVNTLDTLVLGEPRFEEIQDLYWLTFHAVARALPDGQSNVVKFNDDAATTDQDVLDVLNAAIDRQVNEGAQ